MSLAPVQPLWTDNSSLLFDEWKPRYGTSAHVKVGSGSNRAVTPPLSRFLRNPPANSTAAPTLRMDVARVPTKRKAASTDSEDDESAGMLPQAKARKRVPTEEWEAKRPIITRLYQEEKRSLKEMMEIMERDYEFTAT